MPDNHAWLEKYGAALYTRVRQRREAFVALLPLTTGLRDREDITGDLRQMGLPSR